MFYADLVIDHNSRHTDELYTYASEEPLCIGQRVLVTFGTGKSQKFGYVFAVDVEPSIDPKRIKTIDGIDPDISLTEEIISTISWMRQRYGIKYLDGVRCFVPQGKPPAPGKNKEPYQNIKGEPDLVSALTPEQSLACRTIGNALRKQEPGRFLLHGVTGSGKTEVYMQAIAEVLAQGRTAIMLVPEIALTKQVIERFVSRFGKKQIAVMHSKLTRRERYDEWVRIRSGEARIVIGARTGVFAPLENIGLIILDEEHEATYKSDQTPKYDTVDIALKRLMHHRGVLILGSATPSVVSYQRAREGIYQLIEMKERYNKVPLPEVELVDMREEIRMGNRSMFSNSLYQQMRQTLDSGSQVILFLNRRGYSTYLSCPDCGESLKCPDCGISLVYHKRENAGICHYCGRKFRVPEECPSCGGGPIRFFGTGTEKVEEFTRELFPEQKVERLDLDTAKNSREIDRILNGFSKKKTNILIGTQLVAKGLDFRNVGLVGVIAADVSLNIPDYRSTERTFQLVTQVAGRAGRGDKRGKVVVQSYTPENFALQAAAGHDYQGFFRQEVVVRQFMGYPPYTDLILVEFTAEEEQDALTQAEKCLEYLKQAELPGADQIFEPRMSTTFKGSGSVRYQFLIKCPKGERNRYIYYIRYFGDQMVRKRVKCNLTIDVNPYSTI